MRTSSRPEMTRMKHFGTSILPLALCVAFAGSAVGDEAPATQQAAQAAVVMAGDVALAAPVKTRFAVRTKVSRYAANAPIPVFWDAPPGHATTDWVGVFAAGAPDTQYLSWSYVPAGTAGSLSLTAPSSPGIYEVRYLRDNGYTSVAGSARFSVFMPPPAGYPICRELGSGDPYHPAWTHCCDSADRTESYWRDSDGNGGWYSGSCYSWDVR
jgi:hypothetical protein